jgi:hypothetical protein
LKAAALCRLAGDVAEMVHRLLGQAALAIMVLARTVWLTWPQPKLRSGMSRGEVHSIWGEPPMHATSKEGSVVQWHSGSPAADSVDFYPDESGVILSANNLRVYYVNDEVVGWEDTRPPLPLLDRIKKALGW